MSSITDNDEKSKVPPIGSFEKDKDENDSIMTTPNIQSLSLDNSCQEKESVEEEKKPKVRRKRRIIKRSSKGGISSRQTIPSVIVDNPALRKAISTSLPSDYEFEIPKTIWRIQQSQCRHVALQLPEGLLLYSCIIADILKTYAWIGCSSSQKDDEEKEELQISILGDVTYGACCIDDLGAKALGADLLVHYGHSCLVPLTCTAIPCLYVFVELSVDVLHMVQCVQATLTPHTHVHVMGTVQVRTHIYTYFYVLFYVCYELITHLLTFFGIIICINNTMDIIIVSICCEFSGTNVDRTKFTSNNTSSKAIVQR